MLKKILMLTTLIYSFSFANNHAIEVRAGVSPAPKFDVTPSKKAEPSYELMAEYRYLLTNNTEIGGGIGYQKHGKLKGFTDIESSTLRVDVKDTELYDSVPVYAAVRYKFKNDSDITPYVRANLGYSFNVNDKNSSRYETVSKTANTVIDSGELKKYAAKNGMYYAVGAGVEYKGFVADLSYQVNTAKVTGVRYDGSVDSGRADNRRITLGLGYSF